MINFRSIAVFLLLLPLSATSKIPDKPKLVVGIVVDQMRWDYLHRYYDRYTEGGFKRMMNKGYSCENTMINFLPSYTGPGHATIYTGSVPAINGIAGNDWFDKETGKTVYCTRDRKVKTVGGDAPAMSPVNLMTTTITDELKLATNMRSKVFSISLKDRGSIFPAGHLANGAFWYDDNTGGFISSSYYMDKLPGWMIDFNNKRYADSFRAQKWMTLYPSKSYKQSITDNSAYAGQVKGETNKDFPHNAGSYNALRYLPAGNTLVASAARACIFNEQLGKSNFTDFLCLSFSAPDYAGHTFGPNSIEVEDMFLRLDMELEAFLNFLDNNVGVGNYVVFLTADHGAAHNANYLKDLKISAGNKGEEEILQELNSYLNTRFGKGNLAVQLMNLQVYLDDKKIAHEGLKRKEVKEEAIDWLSRQKEVAFAADLEHMGSAALPEPIKTAVINGYHRKRGGDIQIVMETGWYNDSNANGTTHGSWAAYDTHIPLLWYGWKIPEGKSYRTEYMTNIAPTLAAMLRIQMPSGCVGRVIEEVVR